MAEKKDDGRDIFDTVFDYADELNPAVVGGLGGLAASKLLRRQPGLRIDKAKKMVAGAKTPEGLKKANSELSQAKGARAMRELIDMSYGTIGGRIASDYRKKYDARARQNPRAK